MGGSSSKVTQLNKSITDVTSEVVAKTSTAASGSITQKQVVNLSGSGSGITLLQNARLSLKALAQSDVNASMQAEIINKIISEVKQKSTDFPQISASKSDTEITNIVENNVSSSFSQSSIATLKLAIDNYQEVKMASGTDYDDVLVEQSADGMGELINNMSGSIVNQLVAGTELEAKSEEVSTNFIADGIGAAGDAVAGVVDSVAGVFGMDTSTIVVIAFCFLLLFIYMMMSRGKPPVPFGHGFAPQPFIRPPQPFVAPTMAITPFSPAQPM
jgi:hypothetical protein